MPKSKKELKNFKPDEVSLVKSGANLKQSFIVKNQNGDDTTMEELIAKLKEFAFSNEAKTDAAIDAVCVAKGLDEGQRSAVKTALAILESMGDSAKGIYFDVSEDYASISIYKSEDGAGGAEGEKLHVALKEEVTKLTSEKEEITKSLETKVEKSELDSLTAEKTVLEENITKLSELIEDKSAVDKVLKTEEPVVVPESVQKALDEKDEKIAKYEAEKKTSDEKIAKAADEKVLKDFEEKASTNYAEVAGSEELGGILKKCSEGLDEETFTSLESILKSSNERTSEGAIFKELGADAPENTSDFEGQVDEKASQIKKENPEVSLVKARIQAREELKKLNK